jgi:hypothetical protein
VILALLGNVVESDVRAVVYQSPSARTEYFVGQGFDKCEIPTLTQMDNWISNSPYRAVNLYIGGSTRSCSNAALSASYVSQLSQQGWKFIPTWVGPQSDCWNKTTNSRISNDPTDAYNQGVSEADAAIVAAKNLGLTLSDGTGTIIYYDLEGYQTYRPGTSVATCRNAAKFFASGWTQRLRERGNLSGVYGSSAAAYLSDFAAIPNVPDAIWPASWFYPSGQGSYRSDATVWNVSAISNQHWSNHQRIRQYAGNIDDTWGGVTLTIDANAIDGIVANLADAPSNPTRTPQPNVATPTTQPPPSASGWNQVFFSDNTLSSSCGSRNETDVYMFRDSDGGWTTPNSCPNVQSAWSARMDRYDAYFQGGIYEFGMFYDDGARLYIDDQLIVDGWSATQHYESRYISPGAHHLRLEYKNNAGRAVIQLWWRGPGALPYMNDAQRDPNQWWVNYWGNQNQWQDSVGRQNEGTGFLNRNWGDGSPGFGIPSDHFSTKSERNVYFDCGVYRFHMLSDDGSRLSIDGNILPQFDHWNAGVWDSTADLSMSAGVHALKVDQFENGGSAKIYLDWALISVCPSTATPMPQPSPTPAVCPTIVDWKGEYWSNENLSGAPILCRNDSELSSTGYEWEDGSPHPSLPSDQFSVSWSRTLYFDPGSYRFDIFHDDGARLLIDGTLVFENWCGNCHREDSVVTTLAQGEHTVVMEYKENIGFASARLRWTNISTPTPTVTLSPTLSPSSTAAQASTATPTRTPTIAIGSTTPTPLQTRTPIPTRVASPTSTALHQRRVYLALVVR